MGVGHPAGCSQPGILNQKWSTSLWILPQAICYLLPWLQCLHLILLTKNVSSVWPPHPSLRRAVPFPVGLGTALRLCCPFFPILVKTPCSSSKIVIFKRYLFEFRKTFLLSMAWSCHWKLNFRAYCFGACLDTRSWMSSLHASFSSLLYLSYHSWKCWKPWLKKEKSQRRSGKRKHISIIQRINLNTHLSGN